MKVICNKSNECKVIGCDHRRAHAERMFKGCALGYCGHADMYVKCIIHQNILMRFVGVFRRAHLSRKVQLT